MGLRIFNKHTKIVFSATYIFAISMIIMLHAALTTITSRSLEKETNILAQELSENIYSSSNQENQEVLLAKFIKDYPATKINIYDNEGKKIISNNENEIKNIYACCIMDYIAKLFLPENHRTIKNSLNGEMFSDIIWSANLNNTDKKYAFMKVTSPITSHFSGKQEKISGAVEVYFDITHDWKMYNNARFFGILLLTIVFFIFYMLLERNILAKKE